MPPVFELSAIVAQLQTQWGDDEGTYRTWVHNGQLAGVIRFSLPDFPPEENDGDDELAGFVPLSGPQKTFAREAFALWDDLIAPSIVETSVLGEQITLSQSSTTKNGGTYASPDVGAQYDDQPESYEIDHERIWLSTTWPEFMTGNLGYGERGLEQMMHEIGHSIGLSHPGSYNASDDTPPTYAADAEYTQDTTQWTIMSYFNAGADGTAITRTPTAGRSDVNGDGVNAATPLLHDIAAIQWKYGADMTTRTGADVYGFNATFSGPYRASFDFTVNVDPVIAIWDAGGIDTLDASGFGQNQRIDIREGAFSDIGALTLNVAIAYGAVIENATGGSGGDTITGNDYGNVLIGNDGNDTLAGGGGDDSLDGGLQDDSLIGSQGADTLLGGDGSDTLMGGFDVDRLDGGAGNDTVDGGSATSGGGNQVTLFDTLTGGTGDDTFVYKTGYKSTLITDFNSRSGESDILDLSGLPIHSFADLLALARRQGADTVFDFGSLKQFDVLKIENFDPDNLAPEAFTFVEDPVTGVGLFSLIANPDIFRPLSTEIAALDDGGTVAVTANIQTYYQQTIFGSRFDARGAPAATFAVNTTPLNFGATHGQQPQVAALSDGRIVAAWQSEDTANGGAGVVRARLFSSDLVPLGDDFVVNSTPFVRQTWSANNPTTSAGLIDLVAQPGGGFLVAWYADEEAGSNLAYAVRQRVFDAAGQPQGPDVAVSAAVPIPSLRDVKGLLLQDGRVLHYWVDGATENSPPYNFVGYLYANIDSGVPIRVMETPFFGDRASVIELDDGRIQFSFPTGVVSGPAVYFGGIASIILDSDLKGFTLPGTGSNETLTGSIDNDRLYGLGGNDTLVGGRGPDILDGGDGTDTADYTRSLGGVNVDLGRAVQLGGHAEGDTLASIENVIGSAYRDAITGDGGANQLTGGYGKDTIDGGGGAGDLLKGEQGDDFLTLRGTGGFAYGGAGKDLMALVGTGGFGYGDAGEDRLGTTGDGNTLYGGDDDSTDRFFIQGNGNIAYGQGGDDFLAILEGDHSSNALFGGAGDDSLFSYSRGPYNTLVGEDGNDEIVGSASAGGFLEGGRGRDTITGGAERDTIYADPFGSFGASPPDENVDSVSAGGGDDYVTSLGGGDTIDSGPGDDLVELDVSWADFGALELTFELVAPATYRLHGDGTLLIGVERLSLRTGFTPAKLDISSVGSELSVAVLTSAYYAGGFDDLVRTGAGADGLSAGLGDDTLMAGLGNDSLDGGEGDDTLFGEGGDDVLNGGEGLDQIWGGEGRDLLTVYAAGRLYVDLRGGIVTLDGVLADTLDSIEDVVANGSVDLVVGNDQANALSAGFDADVLFGMGGDDLLVGGDGLFFAPPPEPYVPGGGNPDVYYNQLFGGGGSDTASYAALNGKVYADIAASGAYVDYGEGYVLVDAYSSIENSVGSMGEDILAGDDGPNRIEGGWDADILYGRGGADTFVYRSAADSFRIPSEFPGGEGSPTLSHDTIADFVSGQDRVDLSALGIDASRVRISSDAASTVLLADTDPATPGYELGIAFASPNAIVLGDLVF